MTGNHLIPKDPEALQAENEELRQQLETARGTGAARWRRILAIVLAVLAIIFTVSSVHAIWLKNTLQDEDRFVSTLQPLTKNEAVATALSTRIADGVIEATNAEAFVTEKLPPDLAFAAAPLTGAISNLIEKASMNVVTSDAVATAWTTALRATHRAASAVISGNDGALVAEGGQVSIDLNEIAGVVLDNVQSAGVPLPETDTSFGQIVLYQSDQLAEAQLVAQGIDTAGWVLPFVALLLFAGALWVAPDRRWMTAFLAFGTAFGLLIALAVLRIGRNAMLADIDAQVPRDAAAAVWDTIVAWLVSSSWALLVLALIIGFAAWAVGPSQRAQRFSAWISTTIDRWRRPEEQEPSGFEVFLAGSKRTIQIVVAVLGLLLLLLGPSMTGLRVILTTLVVLAIIVLVEVFAGPAIKPETSTADTEELVDV